DLTRRPTTRWRPRHRTRAAATTTGSAKNGTDVSRRAKTPSRRLRHFSRRRRHGMLPLQALLPSRFRPRLHLTSGLRQRCPARGDAWVIPLPPMCLRRLLWTAPRLGRAGVNSTRHGILLWAAMLSCLGPSADAAVPYPLYPTPCLWRLRRPG